MHLLGAKFTSENLDGAVADYFVRVHVGLCAGASLPDNEWEVIVQLASNDLVTSLNDCVGCLLFKTEIKVRLGGTLFEETESLDDGEGHALALSSYLEVLERTLRLGTPVSVSWHLDGTKSVSLFPELLSRGK